MYYPLMLDLSQFKCLVVGGGMVACRKAKGLLHYGGQVTVLSESFVPELEALPIEGIVTSFEERYLEGYNLIVAATDDKACNAQIGMYCRKNHILCNVATDEKLSSFIVPSSMKRGDLVISVSTGGKSPALAARIQRELEEKYDESFGEYVHRLGEIRNAIKNKVSDEKERRNLLRGLLDMSIEELMAYEIQEEDCKK